MTQCKMILKIGLLAYFILACQVAVAGNWWDKGLEIFNSIKEDSAVSDINVDKISTADIGAAFKDALRIGSKQVVKRLGAVDGFNKDAAVHIPLPSELKTVRRILAKLRMEHVVDKLEVKLNRAAEVATLEAKSLFLQAISEMTFDDVNRIYKGPEDSATQYFKQKMSSSLREKMRPIVDASLSEVGAIKAMDSVMGKYQSLPFVPDVKSDLTDHVVQKGMEGIFYYIAKEEASIRKDPARHTTDLLKKVFGL